MMVRWSRFLMLMVLLLIGGCEEGQKTPTPPTTPPVTPPTTPPVTPPTTPPPEPEVKTPVITNLGLGLNDNSGVWINTKNVPCPAHVTFFTLDSIEITKVTQTTCSEGLVTLGMPDEVKLFHREVLVNVQRAEGDKTWSESKKLELRPQLFPSDGLGIGFNMPNLGMSYLLDSENPREGEVVKKSAKRGIKSAYQIGAQHLAIFLPGYFPRTTTDVKTGRNNLILWQTNPGLYWERMDEMFKDISLYGLGIVIRGWNDLYMFPALTGETMKDLLSNYNSKSFKLYSQYWREFATRYGKHPNLIALGAPNELNLDADLDLVKRCRESNPNSHLTSCDVVANFTTDDVIAFNKKVVEIFKAHAPNVKTLSGLSIPRPAAAHLRKTPEWLGGDWTGDSQKEFETLYKELQAPFDYSDSHIYNSGDHRRFGYGEGSEANADLISYLEGLATKNGKRLYVGEYADGTASGVNTQAFTYNVTNLLGTGSFRSASIWALEFYQFNTYVLQEGSVMESNNSNLFPLFNLIKRKRDELANNVSKIPAYTANFDGASGHIAFPYDGSRISGATLLTVLPSGGSGTVSKVELTINGDVIRTLTQWPYQTTIRPDEATSGEKLLKAIIYSSNGTTAETSIKLVFP